MQRSVPSFVFRSVPDAPDADKLGLPSAVAGWGDVKRGLVVVTGPTGSGKSTTCAAVIDRINATRDCHILTIEDPIEFLQSGQARDRLPARDRPGRAELRRGVARGHAPGPRRDHGR